MAKKKKKKQASGGKLVNANKKLQAIVEQRHRGKEFPGSLLASLFIARKFVAHTHLKQHGHFLGNFLFQEMLLKTPYTYKRPYLYNNYTILLVYNKCTVRNAFFLDICLFSYHKDDTSSLFTMLMIFLSDYLGLKYKIITVLYTRVVFSIMFSCKEIVDEFPVGDSVGKIPFFISRIF